MPSFKVMTLLESDSAEASFPVVTFKGGEEVGEVELVSIAYSETFPECKDSRNYLMRFPA